MKTNGKSRGIVLAIGVGISVLTASAVLERISPVLSGEMLQVMSDMGHGEEIVIADANFPAHSVCDRVIRADGIAADALLRGLAPLFTLDTYSVPLTMMKAVPGDQLDPSVEARYRKALDYTNVIERVDRFDFYKRASQARAVIVTGETAKYGNILLKKGVVPPFVEERRPENGCPSAPSSSRPIPTPTRLCRISPAR